MRIGIWSAIGAQPVIEIAIVLREKRAEISGLAAGCRLESSVKNHVGHICAYDRILTVTIDA
jgi:hypothetical protein